jgi:hypothetical protein
VNTSKRFTTTTTNANALASAIPQQADEEYGVLPPESE